MSDGGHIELERQVDSIRVGVRHRTELGDLRPLMDSIQRLGLLQPVTIDPDGVLICGRRRLEAVKRLGWNTVRVWVRTGLSGALSQLLAEQDENVTHKPLSPREAAAMYRELKALLVEDAARRQAASRFGADNSETAGQHGGVESTPPQTAPGKARVQAARVITGRDSHQVLERISEIERISADASRSAPLRQIAADELEAIRNGGGVDPSYQRVKAAIRIATLSAPPETDEEILAQAKETLAQSQEDHRQRVKENRAKRASAAANAKRSVRSFALMWAELDGWSKHYNTAAIAGELKADDWALFLRVLDETKNFAESVDLVREQADT